MEHQPLLFDEKNPSSKDLGNEVVGVEDPELAQVLLELENRRRIRKRKCRRFLHFLAVSAVVGMVVWMRYGAAVSTMGSDVKESVKALVGCGGGGHHHHEHPFPKHRGVTIEECKNWNGEDKDDLTPYPLPLESLSTLFPPGNPEIALNVRGGKFSERTLSSASAKFTFPLNNTQKGEENKFFFLSRGSWSAGRVNVFQKGCSSVHGEQNGVVSSVKEKNGEVKVRVDVTYEHKRFLDYVKICKISVNTTGFYGVEGESTRNSTGVGIFTPESHHRRHRHGHPAFETFKVAIEFPKTSSSSSSSGLKTKPITITEFISDLPLFSQTFGNLKNVYFEKFLAASENAPVEAVSVWGDQVFLANVNAAIKGTFKVLSSVALFTKNAPIEAEIELVKHKAAVNSTIANLVSVKGQVTAHINLTSATKDGAGGDFIVGAAAVHSPISLSFPSAPINSTLRLKASGIVSPINVSLHPTYQGTFALKTLFSSTKLEAKTDWDDPEGKGRKKRLELSQRGRARLDGATWWDEEWKGSGDVKVESAFAPVVLNL